MIDLIEKLKALAELLESRIADAATKQKQLDIELSLVKDREAKLSAKMVDLNSREKAVSSIESVVRVSEESRERLSEAGKIKADNAKVAQDLAAEKKALDAKNEDLNKTLALYRSKIASLEAEKVQLEKDRKEMRVQIIDELKKLK